MRGQAEGGNIWDTLVWVGLVAFLIASGAGLAIMNGLLAVALAWLVDAKLLATEHLLWTFGALPGGQQVGVDPGRAFVIVLAAGLLLAGLVYIARSRASLRARDE